MTTTESQFDDPTTPIRVVKSFNKNEKQRKKINPVVKALGVGAVAGAILFGAGSDQASEAFHEAGYAPSPAVSSAGSDVLIESTDTLLDYGPGVLGLGIIGGAAYATSRRRNPDGVRAEMHGITNQVSRRNQIVYKAAVMGMVAGAIGLGSAASEGANEPIKDMALMMGANPTETPLVTASEVLPMNTTVIDYPAVSSIIVEAGGTPVPFIVALGDVENPKSETNPSSAPIVAVPDIILKSGLGVSMPEVSDCKDMTVIVGEQLGAKTGDTILINDRPATVAGTADQMPGLDRVSVLTSLEQSQQCLYPDLPMSGAVALGLEGRQDELEQKIREFIDPAYSAGTFEEFQERYEEFWERSVKPPQMILILAGLALGSTALAGRQTAEILMRRKNIGMQLSQGVSTDRIIQAYRNESHMDTLKAVPLSIPIAIGGAYVYNSSQFGIAESLNISSLGASYAALAMTTAATSVLTARIVKRMDRLAELRSSV